MSDSRHYKYKCRKDLLNHVIANADRDIVVGRYDDLFFYVKSLPASRGYEKACFFNDLTEYRTAISFLEDTVREVISRHKDGTLDVVKNNPDMNPKLRRLYVNWFCDVSYGRLIVFDNTIETGANAADYIVERFLGYFRANTLLEEKLIQSKTVEPVHIELPGLLSLTLNAKPSMKRRHTMEFKGSLESILQKNGGLSRQL